MKEHIMKCLAEQKSVFTVNDFTNSLKASQIIKNNDKQKSYYILNTLVKEKHIQKTSRSTYKKIIDLQYPISEFAKKFIDECQNKNAVQELSMGGIFWKMSDVSLLGVPENQSLPKWKKEIFDLLLERMTLIFDSIRYLVTNDSSKPIHSANYLRQMMLEIIPHYLGARLGEDRDGEEFYKLRDEVENLIRVITMHGYDTSNMVDRFTKIKKWTEQSCSGIKSSEITDKFGMVLLPPNYVIDSDNAADELVLSMLKQMDDEESKESIVSMLVTQMRPEYVTRALKKYKNYFQDGEIDKIIHLHEKIELGMRVAPLFYSMDFHLKVQEGLENKAFVGGNYYNGKHVGKVPKSEEFHNFTVYGCLIYDEVLKSEEYRIPSKKICKKEISEKTCELLELCRDYSIRKLLEAACFQNKIKLCNSVPFEPDDLDLGRIMERLGSRGHIDDIPDWMENSKKDANEFVKRWLHSK